MSEVKSDKELATELVIKCIDKSIITDENAVETAWKRFFKMIRYCYKDIPEKDRTD